MLITDEGAYKVPDWNIGKTVGLVMIVVEILGEIRRGYEWRIKIYSNMEDDNKKC